MINDGFFTVLQVVTEFNQGGVIVQNDKYETQMSELSVTKKRMVELLVSPDSRSFHLMNLKRRM